MRSFLLGPLQRAGQWRRSWDPSPASGQKEEVKEDGDGRVVPQTRDQWPSLCGFKNRGQFIASPCECEHPLDIFSGDRQVLHSPGWKYRVGLP